jgi:hypothetical protein
MVNSRSHLTPELRQRRSIVSFRIMGRGEPIIIRRERPIAIAVSLRIVGLTEEIRIGDAVDLSSRAVA